MEGDVELYLELTRKYLMTSASGSEAETDELLAQLDDLWNSLSPEDQQAVNNRLLAGAEVLTHGSFDLDAETSPEG